MSWVGAGSRTETNQAEMIAPLAGFEALFQLYHFFAK
jgi:hypothetical protein